MPIDPEATIRCSKDVAHRVLDGEAVLLDLRSGTYFGLNDVASRAWELMSRGARVSAIVAALLEEFEADAATLGRDVDELVAKLAERGLVEIGELDPSAAPR